MPRPFLIFLDRDGVLNQDSPDFIKSVDELELIPGSADAVASLTSAGHSIVVATNQSGIARGLIDTDALSAIHASIEESITARGGRIDHFQICPHAPDKNCPCRKPAPGMIHAARARLEGSFERMLFVGDRMTDLEAAVAAECHPILVRTGHGPATEKQLAQTPRGFLTTRVEVFDDLARAADAILGGMFDARTSSA